MQGFILASRWNQVVSGIIDILYVDLHIAYIYTYSRQPDSIDREISSFRSMHNLMKDCWKL